MSHSKFTKRGKSLYIDSWNPSAKRFINTCATCGAMGYSPTIDDDGFVYNESRTVTDFEHRAIRDALRKAFKPLTLDARGLCEVCARVIDKN